MPESYNWIMNKFADISNAVTPADPTGSSACVPTDALTDPTAGASGSTPTHIRLFGATPDSIVDGPGLRYAIFVQGCTHACPGCHNPESWTPDGGTLTTIDALMADVQAAGLTQGVTLSGGDPFDQAEASAEVARRCKAAGLNLWTFTGYLYEDLLRQAAVNDDAENGTCPAGTPTGHPVTQTQTQTQAATSDNARARAIRDLLDATDVLVDGPFIESQRSLELQWRGSTNQRLIDLPATRAAGHIVEWRAPAFDTQKPESW